MHHIGDLLMWLVEEQKRVLEENKNYASTICLARECGTVRLALGRQSGHTTSAINLANLYKNPLLLTRHKLNDNQRHSLQRQVLENLFCLQNCRPGSQQEPAIIRMIRQKMNGGPAIDILIVDGSGNLDTEDYYNVFIDLFRKNLPLFVFVG